MPQRGFGPRRERLHHSTELAMEKHCEIIELCELSSIKCSAKPMAAYTYY